MSSWDVEGVSVEIAGQGPDADALNRDPGAIDVEGHLSQHLQRLVGQAEVDLETRVINEISE